MNGLESENELLKKVILRQQEYFEICRRSDMKPNVMVSGIPNGEFKINDNTHDEGIDKIAAILNYIGINARNKVEYEFQESPSLNNKTYSAKLKFNSNKVNYFLHNSKNLKNLSDTMIYVKSDEPYHTRKENSRVRKRK